MSSPGAFLKLAKVSKRFDSPDSARSITVLDEISLEAGPAESIAIIGPSGSGKSTLLQIVGTLDHPSSGEVIMDGQNLTRMGEKELAAVRNRQIGFVFQSHYLLPQCTVLENVLVPTLAMPLARDQSFKPRTLASGELTDEGSISSFSAAAGIASESPLPESAFARAVRLLTRVGLAERLSHRPGQLSGGERQRVAVVRALINQPKLLLADEPTGSLDQASAEQLGHLLIDLNREERVGLVVVTHSRELARLMGRVLELKAGHLVSV